MFNCNMRRYYLPDMISLQEAMYQLSRLLADLHPDLYAFLEYNGISPVLYLTPWFLTCFASNFPLNFAVRVLGKISKSLVFSSFSLEIPLLKIRFLDTVIAEGPAAIFKFSLAILISKKSEMMLLDGFECVADYIKNQLNNVDNVQTVRNLVEVASQVKLGNRLDIYATEYAVLSENDLLREPGQNWSPSKNIVKDLR